MAGAANQAFLCQISPNDTVGERWIVGDKPMVVGRDEAADVRIADETLSRGHFLIVCERDEFFLVDLDSRNGTWVNGCEVSAHRLQSGDTIHVGESVLRFSSQIPAQKPLSALRGLLSNSQGPVSPLISI
jgi:pSer/pThr/pTyr-binding forkhead associated (FHA) protein